MSDFVQDVKCKSVILHFDEDTYLNLINCLDLGESIPGWSIKSTYPSDYGIEFCVKGEELFFMDILKPRPDIQTLKDLLTSTRKFLKNDSPLDELPKLVLFARHSLKNIPAFQEQYVHFQVLQSLIDFNGPIEKSAVNDFLIIYQYKLIKYIKKMEQKNNNIKI